MTKAYYIKPTLNPEPTFANFYLINTKSKYYMIWLMEKNSQIIEVNQKYEIVSDNHQSPNRSQYALEIIYRGVIRSLKYVLVNLKTQAEEINIKQLLTHEDPNLRKIIRESLQDNASI